MGKIYVGQTALTIELATGVSLSGSSVYVRYKKPNGDTGQWDATITGDTIVKYSAQVDDIDQAGEWTFWSKVVFGDSTWAPGEPIKETIYEEGE